MGLLHAFESREDIHQLNLLLLQNFNVVKKKNVCIDKIYCMT